MSTKHLSVDELNNDNKVTLLPKLDPMDFPKIINPRQLDQFIISDRDGYIGQWDMKNIKARIARVKL